MCEKIHRLYNKIKLLFTGLFRKKNDKQPTIELLYKKNINGKEITVEKNGAVLCYQGSTYFWNPLIVEYNKPTKLTVNFEVPQYETDKLNEFKMDYEDLVYKELIKREEHEYLHTITHNIHYTNIINIPETTLQNVDMNYSFFKQLFAKMSNPVVYGQMNKIYRLMYSFPSTHIIKEKQTQYDNSKQGSLVYEDNGLLFKLKCTYSTYTFNDKLIKEIEFIGHHFSDLDSILIIDKSTLNVNNMYLINF